MNRSARSAAVTITAFLLVADAARAQSVLLQIKPRMGDTLSVRLDQKVEMTGTPVGCVTAYSTTPRGGEAEPRQQLCSETTRQMTTRMEVFSRAIAHGSSPGGTLLRAVTDSIRTSTSSGRGRSSSPRRIQGPHDPVEFRMSTDGSAEVVDAGASDELRTIFGQMPATLSRRPVSFGERWVRQMRIPLSGERGATGLVTATFRFDSLGRNGDIAYISMRGTISRDHRDGNDSGLPGSLSGAMRLDRRLAWITDARATIDVRSTVKQANGQPMAVRTRVSQHLWAGPAR